jgi:D-beta-D-heptose 7-phosphate kinase/D-beta-D-heptose 1-phosphate adenosyltransferase
MTRRFSDTIERFSGMKVLVLGEAMLDSYLEGPTSRLCQEAPVPVVNVESQRHVPGGAANTAVNLKALMAEPILLSAVGDDGEGRRIVEALAMQGISCETISRDSRRQTLAKQRVVGANHLLVRFDQGTTSRLAEDTEHELLERLISLHRQCDAIVISDYCYGIVTPRIIRCLSHLQRRQPKLLVVDSKRLPDYRMAQAAAVKPNYSESLELLKLSPPNERKDRVAHIEAYGSELLDLTGARLAAVTMDVDGALFFEPGKSPYRTYARPQPQANAAGAGDTFLAALTLALASGAETAVAAEISSAAAAVVVTKNGTSACASDELQEQLCTPEKIATSRSRLAARCELYRRYGKRIVLTGGCFDILHSGHVSYLNQAKSLGDVLIVAINSDDSVRRLKGQARPINRVEDRLHVLAALSSIDHLIVFDENTPIDLIEAIRPHVFAKGGDYDAAMLPEASTVARLGGELRILPFIDDRSTTNIIERIRKLDAAHAAPTRLSLTLQLNEDGHDKHALANGSKHPLR